MKQYRFPPGFKLGVATSATQIEGAGVVNNWSDWAERGRIKDGSSPTRAADHWHRYREDIDLMADMGLQIYRFGIEWSRLEPEPNQYDAAVLQRYREEILYLKERGIEPLLTLHHFNNPLWLQAAGAFENPKSIDALVRLTEHVVSGLGDLVAEYVTINEPNIYATHGYLFGLWPPGRKSLFGIRRVYNHLAAAHLLCYRRIHELRRSMGFTDTRVGFAHHLQVFTPLNTRNPLHRLSARVGAYLFQDVLSEAFFAGRFKWPLRNVRKLPEGRYCDFIGINYYSRAAVKSFRNGAFPGVELNDLGWEIYPQGIGELARQMWDKWQLPVYITENGTCDNSDAFRERYIKSHLAVLLDCGADVTRYYHWCFTDNWEWLEGEVPRFGLVHLNYETQERTIKASGHAYSRMIREGGFTHATPQSFGE